jgi:hypothetical protein
MYKPYTPEWNRQRYLRESIQRYFEEGESAEVVIDDLRDIFSQWVKETETRNLELRQVLDNLQTK